jgi:Tfp pilus assembly PilM family ATPase
MIASLKQFVSIPVEIMNPFKRVALPHSLQNYSEIENRKQEYASAVGLAMRTE